jgi:hypothetical protein
MSKKTNMDELTQEEVVNLTSKRDHDVVPVAKKAIKLMAEAIDNIPLGSFTVAGEPTKQEFQDAINTFYGETFIPLLIESNLKLDELNWLFLMVIQPFAELKEVSDRSFNDNKEIADAIVYGIKPGEMRVLDLDNAMKSKS